MPINEAISESIFTGLCLFIGVAFLLWAVRGWMSEGFKRRFDSRWLRLFRHKQVGEIKENSIIAIVALVFMYAAGHALLHVMEDFTEDKLPETRFEKGKDVIEDDKWNTYHGLSEGGGEEGIKFTRIGELEAREDQIDRESLDKEKSYIQIIRAGFLLDFLTFLAALTFIIPAFNDLSRESAGAATKSVGEESPPAAPPGQPATALQAAANDRPAVEQAAQPSKMGSIVNAVRSASRQQVRVIGSLLVLILTILLGLYLYVEHREIRDKYERLVFHVWKKHREEGESNKKEKAQVHRDDRTRVRPL
ncbi:MAG TPA: hypothetical protein VKA60_09085 [Blastocatellia bacterium]|nr:hypothetical protein [Blastocatellia bacterium]